ncbi:hypothetical protein GOP47_0016813 [Adiantum capillus-veneris]|uniref:Uncharacterized protein n=1 Tax=Adiantum capillus-veneris TaxID=13818 RepID=A0A9D4ZAN6_ADICA|nr:hypothetical protein GOP47_0016813 [Adiantum capillus-veneris]
MQGGSGEDSYANSSSPQNFIFRVYTRPHLSQALDLLCQSPLIIHSLQLAAQHHEHRPDIIVASAIPAADSGPHAGLSTPPPRLAIADLGCSHGRNTLDYAAFILQGLHNRLFIKGMGRSLEMPLEMQYLFSDLPANNFNSLFQSLQGFLQEMGDHMSASCRIFTGAIAGSFHGPLFPTSSLHFAMSAYSLHWLSQVPPQVLDRSSPAWNGGSIWLNGQRPKVIEAFASQYQKDMRGFFQTRARELVKGGILFILLPCRAEQHPSGPFYDPRIDLWTGFFESTWSELVSEGVISEEERDMFNIPFYMCHESEIGKLLEEFIGVLEIVKLEVMSNCFGMPQEDEQKLLEDPQAFGKLWATFIASLVRPMVEAHLGETRGKIFFKRLEAYISNQARASTYRRNNLLVAIMRRI